MRRLLGHPEVELTRAISIEHVGQPLSAAHPNLDGASDILFEDIRPTEAAQDVDVVFFGLPHDVSVRVVPEVSRASSAKLIDLSGAFRCRDGAQYARWYGSEHPRPDLLDQFVYGLPELNRARIREARYVASPGCFATTIELGLLPLARRGWLEGPIETVAMTGSSGSGTAPRPTTHHPVRSVNLRTYSPLAHPQQPEILETLEAAGGRGLELCFVPISAPLSRGLFATTFVRVPSALTEDQIRTAFAEVAASEPFVRVPTGRLPEVAAVAGSNHVEVGVVLGPAREGARTLSCFSALDNLVKGGAGQAVQSMNLMLGLEETLSLKDPGGFP